jgi:hypothetical protein
MAGGKANGRIRMEHCRIRKPALSQTILDLQGVARNDLLTGCTAFRWRMRIDTNASAGRGKRQLFKLLGAVRQKNAGWTLDSGLAIEHDPCWGMVARVFLPTRPSVNTAVHEPDR